MRRSLLFLGVGLFLVAVGSTVKFAQINPSLALYAEAVPTTSSTAKVASEPSPPGGLGNTRNNLEKLYGQPTGLQGTMTAYHNGKEAATYTNGRATALLLTFSANRPTSLAAGRKATQPFRPGDSEFIGTLSDGPNRTADVYRSQALGKYVAPPSPKDPRGQYVIIYEFDQTGSVKDVLLTVGSIPKPNQ